MKRTQSWGWVSTVALLAMGSLAYAGDPEREADLPSQSAADILREAAGAEIAFLAAGMVRNIENPTDLAQILVYPTDTLSVLKLRGSQVREALERSVALLPLPSSSFLQLSGIEATYSRAAQPDSRLTDVLVGGSKLDDARSYTVAMPTTLARGGLGYFKVWDRQAIERTLEGQTLESLLSGKRVTPTSSRWNAVP